MNLTYNMRLIYKNDNGTLRYWEKLSLTDGLNCYKFKEDIIVGILCKYYQKISTYVRCNPSIDNKVAFYYLPIFRRTYQYIIDFISLYELIDLSNDQLRYFIYQLINVDEVIEFINQNMLNILNSLSTLDLDAEAETCKMISYSLSNRYNNLIKLNYSAMIRNSNIDSICDI